MSKYIFIEADTNDGDYVSRLSEITEEDLILIQPVIQAIKDFEPYSAQKPGHGKCTHFNNYPTLECHRGDLGEKDADELYGHLEGFYLFDELTPYSEYGVHTIVEIRVLHVTNDEKLLSVINGSLNI